jgi:hypothetical protein
MVLNGGISALACMFVISARYGQSANAAHNFAQTFTSRIGFAMKRLATIATCVALAGCASPVVHTKRLAMSNAQINEIKNVTRHNLKDPESAQFRDIRRTEFQRQDGTSNTLVCGEINGKNAFGGYVGFSTFKGNFKGNAFQLHGIGDRDSDWLYVAMCQAGGQ